MRVAIIAVLLSTVLLPAVSLAQTAQTNTPNTTSGTSAAANTRDDASENERIESHAPTSPHKPNAPTLAQLAEPDDNELSRANIELLAKNSELQGRIDELTTQVNVLVNERSGQLFLYGVISTLVSFVLGFTLASLITKRK